MIPHLFFFWQTPTATPGSAPWPLMQWFESPAPPPSGLAVSAAVQRPVVSMGRPAALSRSRSANTSRTR